MPLPLPTGETENDTRHARHNLHFRSLPGRSMNDRRSSPRFHPRKGNPGEVGFTRQRSIGTLSVPDGGCSSGVEHLVVVQDVAGSNPVSRPSHPYLRLERKSAAPPGQTGPGRAGNAPACNSSPSNMPPSGKTSPEATNWWKRCCHRSNPNPGPWWYCLKWAIRAGRSTLIRC